MKYTNAQIKEVVEGLFENSYEKAKMIMMKRGFSEADAEDAVQDALEKMINLMKEGTESDMNEAYFVTAVKHAGIDVKRSVYSKRTVQGDDVKEHHTMEQINLGSSFLIGNVYDEDTIDMALVMDIINTKIKPKHKEAIELVYFRGYSAHEIEKVFGINHNSILGRLRHAYSAIRMFYNLYKGEKLIKKVPSELQKKNRYVRGLRRHAAKETHKNHWGTDKNYNK